jgi:hypothetical protein
MARAAMSAEEIEATLMALLSALGPGRTLGPTDVARALGGDHPDGWGPLMQPIRRVAVRLMKDGKLVILRTGRAAGQRGGRRLVPASRRSGLGEDLRDMPGQPVAHQPGPFLRR